MTDNQVQLQDDDAAVIFRADGSLITLISVASAANPALAAMIVAQLFSNEAFDDILQALMRRACGRREGSCSKPSTRKLTGVTMFSIASPHLPSTTTYRGAENIFNRHHNDLVKGTRKHRFWSDTRVPLRDRSSDHLCVEKSEGMYSFCLYRTPVVKWIDDNTVFVDVSYNSTSTYTFARRFIPFHTYNYKGQPCILCAAGQLVKNKGTFRRNKAGVWEPMGTYNKPTKEVVNTEVAKEINAKLKPLYNYIKEMWAIAGGNPFREEMNAKFYSARGYFNHYRHNIPDMTDVENRLELLAATNPRIFNTPTALIKEIREAAYRQYNGYKEVNYDE